MSSSAPRLSSSSSSAGSSTNKSSPAQKTNQPALGWEYAAHPRYRNPLPELPFEPKLITPQFTLKQHYQYKPEDQTALEGIFSLGVNTADDLFGTSLNWMEMGLLEKIMRRDPFAPKSWNTYHPMDVELIRADPYAPVPVHAPKAVNLTHTPTIPTGKLGRRPSSAENRNLSWLRRTTYIASDIKPRGWNEEIAIKPRKKVLNDPLGEELMKDSSIESQLRLIESTFRSVQEGLDNLDTLEHPTKKGVTAVEVIPVYPDFQIYGSEYIIVNFDDEPFPTKRDDEGAQTALEEAILVATEETSALDPSNVSRYMTVYRPDEESTRKMVTKRQRGEEFGDDPNTVYHYDSVQDYDYNLITFDYRIPVREEDSKKQKKRTIDAPSDERYKRLCISIRDVGEGRGAFFYQFDQILGLKKRRILNPKRRRKKVTQHLEVRPRPLTAEEIGSKRLNLMTILNDEAQVDELVQDDEEALRQHLEAEGTEGANGTLRAREEYQHINGMRMSEMNHISSG